VPSTEELYCLKKQQNGSLLPITDQNGLSLHFPLPPINKPFSGLENRLGAGNIVWGNKYLPTSPHNHYCAYDRVDTRPSFNSGKVYGIFEDLLLK